MAEKGQHIREGPSDLAGMRFEQLYRRTYSQVFGYCYRRTENMHDAEDAVSEVFIVAWRRFDDVSTANSPLAWLYAVANRTLSNQNRGRRRAGNLLERVKSRSTSPTILEDVATRVAASVDASRKANAILALLNGTDQEIVRLAAWEQLSQKEIAQVLGLKEGTIRTRMYRLRRLLRTQATGGRGLP